MIPYFIVVDNKYDEMGGEVMSDYYSLIFVKSKKIKDDSVITEETLDILDDIEDISDMIVQSDIYVSYRRAKMQRC